MPIIIPSSVIKEIELINKEKKRIRKQKVEKLPDRNILLDRTIANIDLLNQVANLDPIASYLVKFDTHIIIIRDIGSLVIASVSGRVGCYLWYDADYPANRTSNDYKLITSEIVRNWPTGPLKVPASLTEKEIWKIILNWLQRHRELI